MDRDSSESGSDLFALFMRSHADALYRHTREQALAEHTAASRIIFSAPSTHTYSGMERREGPRRLACERRNPLQVSMHYDGPNRRSRQRRLQRERRCPAHLPLKQTQ
jgi:hypothetical protein